MAPTAWITRITCANKCKKEHMRCNKAPQIECTKCGLVKFCSEACRDQDKSAHHEKICTKHQEAMKRSVDDQGQSESDDISTSGTIRGRLLFSSWPAHNIVPPDHPLWNQDVIHILQAASGDFGSLMKTVAEYPKNSDAKLYFTINDRESIVSARNLIIILTCLYPGTNIVAVSEAIVHFWYSMFLPEWALDLIDKAATPSLMGFALALADADDDQLVQVMLPFGNNRDKMLELILRKRTIDEAANLLMQENLKMSPSRMQRSRVHAMLHQNLWGLNRPKPMYEMSREWYGLAYVVLPISNSAKDFKNPNPSMFVGDGFVELGGQPIDGWNIEDVMKVKCNAPSNDIYGKMFYYVRNLVAKFIQNLNVGDKIKKITLSQLDFSCSREKPLTEEYDLIDVTNMEKTMSVDGFSDTIRSFDHLLADLPHSGFVYDYRRTKPEDAPLWGVEAALSDLSIRQSSIVNNWSTKFTSPELNLIYLERRAYASSEDGDVMDTPQESPVGATGLQCSDNDDDLESDNHPIVAAPDKDKHMYSPALSQPLDNLISCPVDAVSTKLQQTQNKTATLTEQLLSSPATQIGNKLGIAAPNEQILAPSSDTEPLDHSGGNIDSTRPGVDTETMAYRSGPNREAKPEDVFIPTGAYVPSHARDHQAASQAQQQQQQRRHLTNSHPYVSQHQYQATMGSYGDAYDPANDAKNLMMFNPTRPDSSLSRPRVKIASTTNTTGPQPQTLTTSPATTASTTITEPNEPPKKKKKSKPKKNKNKKKKNKVESYSNDRSSILEESGEAAVSSSTAVEDKTGDCEKVAAVKLLEPPTNDTTVQTDLPETQAEDATLKDDPAAAETEDFNLHAKTDTVVQNEVDRVKNSDENDMAKLEENSIKVNGTAKTEEFQVTAKKHTATTVDAVIESIDTKPDEQNDTVNGNRVNTNAKAKHDVSPNGSSSTMHVKADHASEIPSIAVSKVMMQKIPDTTAEISAMSGEGQDTMENIVQGLAKIADPEIKTDTDVSKAAGAIVLNGNANAKNNQGPAYDAPKLGSPKAKAGTGTATTTSTNVQNGKAQVKKDTKSARGNEQTGLGIIQPEKHTAQPSANATIATGVTFPTDNAAAKVKKPPILVNDTVGNWGQKGKQSVSKPSSHTNQAGGALPGSIAANAPASTEKQKRKQQKTKASLHTDQVATVAKASSAFTPGQTSQPPGMAMTSSDKVKKKKEEQEVRLNTSVATSEETKNWAVIGKKRRAAATQNTKFTPTTSPLNQFAMRNRSVTAKLEGSLLSQGLMANAADASSSRSVTMKSTRGSSRERSTSKLVAVPAGLFTNTKTATEPVSYSNATKSVRMATSHSEAQKSATEDREKVIDAQNTFARVIQVIDGVGIAKTKNTTLEFGKLVTKTAGLTNINSENRTFTEDEPATSKLDDGRAKVGDAASVKKEKSSVKSAATSMNADAPVNSGGSIKKTDPYVNENSTVRELNTTAEDKFKDGSVAKKVEPVVPNCDLSTMASEEHLETATIAVKTDLPENATLTSSEDTTKLLSSSKSDSTTMPGPFINKSSPISTAENPIFTEGGAKIKPGFSLDNLTMLEKCTARTWEEATGRSPMRDVPWTKKDWVTYDGMKST